MSVLLTQMSDTPDIETALRKILSDYLRLKIEALQAQINAIESKWRMSFAEFAQEFEADGIEDSHSYSVESDFWEWEAAETLLEQYQSLREQWI